MTCFGRVRGHLQTNCITISYKNIKRCITVVGIKCQSIFVCSENCIYNHIAGNSCCACYEIAVFIFPSQESVTCFGRICRQCADCITINYGDGFVCCAVHLKGYGKATYNNLLPYCSNLHIFFNDCCICYGIAILVFPAHEGPTGFGRVRRHLQTNCITISYKNIKRCITVVGIKCQSIFVCSENCIYNHIAGNSCCACYEIAVFIFPSQECVTCFGRVRGHLQTDCIAVCYCDGFVGCAIHLKDYREASGRRNKLPFCCNLQIFRNNRAGGYRISVLVFPTCENPTALCRIGRHL